MSGQCCDRCAELEEEVIQLKQHLLGGDKAFPISWRLTKAEAIVLQHLAARERVTLASMTALLWSGEPPDSYADIVRRHIYHLRQKVGWLRIETVYGEGYRISAEARGRLTEART